MIRNCKLLNPFPLIFLSNFSDLVMLTFKRDRTFVVWMIEVGKTVAIRKNALLYYRFRVLSYVLRGIDKNSGLILVKVLKLILDGRGVKTHF